jgi:hypothetical protein
MTVALIGIGARRAPLRFLALDQEQCDGTILATELFPGGVAERLNAPVLKFEFKILD